MRYKVDFMNRKDVPPFSGGNCYDVIDTTGHPLPRIMATRLTRDDAELIVESLNAYDDYIEFHKKVA